MCRSEWHTPQRSMRMSTSLPFGSGQSTMVSQSGCLIGGEREAAEVCHLDILAASNARARATKPSTGISSARAVGSMPAAASSGSGSGPSDFRLCRSILRRWPNAASVTRSSSAAVAGQRRRRAGSVRPPTRSLWAAARSSKDARRTGFSPCVRQPASTDSRPYVLAARRGDDALGDLALKHQHQAVVPRRPWLGGKPRHQQRGRDVVGQVGDDARRPAVQAGLRVEFAARRLRRW